MKLTLEVLILPLLSSPNYERNTDISISAERRAKSKKSQNSQVTSQYLSTQILELYMI